MSRRLLLTLAFTVASACPACVGKDSATEPGPDADAAGEAQDSGMSDPNDGGGVDDGGASLDAAGFADGRSSADAGERTDGAYASDLGAIDARVLADASLDGPVVTITPGAVWNDTRGGAIAAYSESIIKVGDTYYWLGEDTDAAPFQSVRCYSSPDLLNWSFVSDVLTHQASGDLGPNRIVERPHVIYNASTRQYVMWMHIDNGNYSDRRAGVATCDSVCGQYTYQGGSKPLGHDSLDDNLFQDGTKAYFLSEDRTDSVLQIYSLSDDYLTVTGGVASVAHHEAPAMMKAGGTYYIFGSYLTGWAPNDNQYSTASSVAGPWASWKAFAPVGSNTCASQTTSILQVVGSVETTYIYLGDRWNSNLLPDTRYIWLPLTISGTSVSMTCDKSWSINVNTGVIVSQSQ